MSRRISALDGLKGVAILMVSMDHISLLTPIRGYFHSFQNGVQIFFMISAFSLYMSWQNRAPSEKHPVRNFFIRRGFRIWPLWWIMVTIYSLLWWPGLKIYLLNMTFLFGFWQYKPGFEVIGGGWSIFVEEIFYALFPFIFAKHVNTLARAAIGSIIFLVFSLAWHKYLAQFIGFPVENFNIFRFPLN